MQHFLGIEELTVEDLESLLGAAAEIKRSAADRRRTRAPSGHILVNLFFESSTRTRVSFEIAARRLGHEVVNWTTQGTSHEKGESLLDTAATLAAMGPAVIVVRHPAAGAPWLLAARSGRAPGGYAVVNAGDGAHEHPSQALLDALTLRERLGSVRGKSIAIVGDLAHSRVARSNLSSVSPSSVPGCGCAARLVCARPVSRAWGPRGWSRYTPGSTRRSRVSTP